MLALQNVHLKKGWAGLSGHQVPPLECYKLTEIGDSAEQMRELKWVTVPINKTLNGTPRDSVQRRTHEAEAKLLLVCSRTQFILHVFPFSHFKYIDKPDIHYWCSGSTNALKSPMSPVSDAVSATRLLILTMWGGKNTGSFGLFDAIKHVFMTVMYGGHAAFWCNYFF